MESNQKLVFITGAASGIGLEIAKTLAQEGARVLITDLDAQKAEAAAALLRSQQLDVYALPCDVSSEAAIEEAVQQTQTLYGGIDILINNAEMQFVAPIEEFPTAKFELLVKIMLVAPFITIKQVLPHMKAKRWGRIINIASINGLVGFAGKAAYNSAKHGVIGLTKVAALEAAEYGVTVNAVCPGYVDTPLVRNQLADLAKTRNVPLEKVLEEVIYPLVPQKKLLAVQEVADYVAFLCSTKAGGVTGQAVVIDGGYTAQ